MSKSAFTLIEIIITVIIIAITASLAFPAFYKMIEFSRTTEALNMLAAIRGSVEKCHVSSFNSYEKCDFGGIDTEDPSTRSDTLFTYSIHSLTTKGYAIEAMRNTHAGGDGVSTIVLTMSTDGVTTYGTGRFAGLR